MCVGGFKTSLYHESNKSNTHGKILDRDSHQKALKLDWSIFLSIDPQSEANYKCENRQIVWYWNLPKSLYFLQVVLHRGGNVEMAHDLVCQ